MMAAAVLGSAHAGGCALERRTTLSKDLSPGDAAPKRFPPSPTQVEPPPQTLRVLTLNLAHGRKLGLHQACLSLASLRDNLTDVAAVFAEQAPDIVALQEADGPSVWTGYVDQVEALARWARYPHRFRGQHGRDVGPIELDYGTALLGRLPLRGARSHRFERSWRDNKGFVVATIKVPGFEHPSIDVVSVHLDFLQARLRHRQVNRMIDDLKIRQNPLIIMGDLNCHWRERTCLQHLAQALGLRAFEPEADLPSFPAEKPRRRLDWILVSSSLRFRSYFTLPDLLSDHRGVVAEIEQASAWE